MTIQFGVKEDEYSKWANNKNIFISRPHFKIVGENGVGIYLLNSYKFRFIPKFYFRFDPTFWEVGIDYSGWILELMWNKHFEINEKEKNRIS